MNMSKSRDIQAKMPSPKVIFYAFWLVTVKVLNSYIITYKSQLFTVLGNGMTSRMLPIPVRYITQRSNPRPNPACHVLPYFGRSM